MDKLLAKIQFKGYVVDYMEFKLNPNYDLEEPEIEMDLNFEHGFTINTEDREFRLSLGCEIFKDYHEKKFPFYLKANLVGEFSYDSTLEEEELKKMLKINSTAILFPYLRAVISTVTAMFSIGSVILPTINISALLEEKDV